MTETTYGYFPDVLYQLGTPELPEDHLTEIETARNGREQRRGLFPAAGYRRFFGTTINLDSPTKKIVRDFLRRVRGRDLAFYLMNPTPDTFEMFPTGTTLGSTGAARIILPSRGSTVTDIKVGTTSQSGLTTIAIAPRPGSYAALAFDGASNYVTCGSSSTLRPTGNFSISAWVWLRSVSGVQRFFDSEVFNASGFALANIGGDLFFRTNQASANTSKLVTGIVPAQAWTHFAAVLSGTNLTLYKNGASLGTFAGINPAVASTVPLTLSAGSSAGSMNGMIGTARLYDAALSAGEIANIYNGVATATPNLRGLWRMNEGYGTTATDYSGYGLNGTLVNSPTWVGGEDEVSFTSTAAGAVTWSGTGHERLVVRSDMDRFTTKFMSDAFASPYFQLAFKEVY
jgi:hypothetical protein